MSETLPNIIHIGKRAIGPGQPCCVIAEAGVNHNGQLALALQMVEAAVEAGADAVKFQTFFAEKLVTRDAPKAAYQAITTDATESQYNMLRRLELSQEDFRKILQHCLLRGILFLSTAFDEDSADLLEQLDVAAFKLPSGEITNLPLLRHVARKGRPIILSTGMATLGEVETAVQVIRQAGNPPLILLHCVSSYPAQPQDANLHAMATMAAAFGVPVGFSDHTLGNEVALAAVALGACVVEKHFTLDPAMPGPDQQASSSPLELCALVRGIRIVESALGNGRKMPAASEFDTAAVARKSVVSVTSIPAGTVLTEEMLAVKRPGTGLSPASLPLLVGRTTRVSISAGDLITWEMLA